MPYEKGTGGESFEVLYQPFRNNYDPNAGTFSNGFELRSTPGPGKLEFSKFVVGAENNRIVWLFNTTASNGTAADSDHSYQKGVTAGSYDYLPGVVTMSFYSGDGQIKLGEVTHSATEGWDRVGGGTSQQGYISSPPPLVKFTVSASHDMAGILKCTNSAVGDYGDKTKPPII